MEGIRDYVIHLSAAALICSVFFRLTRGKGAVGIIVKLLCGIFLAYSIVKPVQQLELRGFEDITADFQQDAEQAVLWGENISADAWSESIRQGAEAYILEKAKAMNVDLAVEVELSEDEIPVPVAALLSGRVAPYAKAVLSDLMAQDLNIPKEKQVWISQ